MVSREMHNSYKEEKKKKKAIIILGIILAVIIVAVIAISIIAGKNVKVMNQAMDSVLNEIRQSYTVIPVDTGEYEDFTLYGIMKFHVDQYNIEGLGNLSIMRMNMGIMQMATVVITPQNKNMPLLSADYLYILNKRKSYLEFYDLVSVKDHAYNKLLSSLSESIRAYDHLENIKTTPAWYEDLLTVTAYKGGTPDTDKDMEGMLIDSISTYIAHSKEIPSLSTDEKVLKTVITTHYTNGLIEKGGISTDVFTKELGEEKTKYFFDNIFFGTAK